MRWDSEAQPLLAKRTMQKSPATYTLGKRNMLSTSRDMACDKNGIFNTADIWLTEACHLHILPTN